MVALDAELAQLIASGDTIAAIKLLREHTGMGLAAARDTVEQVRAGSPIAPIGTAAAAAPAIPDAVRALVERGERIAAIRWLREHTGLGLKDAKDCLDRAFGAAPVLVVGSARMWIIAVVLAAAVAWLALR